MPGKTGPIIPVFRLLGLAFSAESLGFSTQSDFATTWMTSRMADGGVERIAHAGQDPARDLLRSDILLCGKNW